MLVPGGFHQQRAILSERLLRAADPSRELDVLDHNGDSFRMDRAQVGILKQMYEVILTSLLQGHERLRLPTLLALRWRRVVGLRDLAHETRERELSDEELGRALVFADLAQRHCPRPGGVGGGHLL